MRIVCPSCTAAYEVPESRLKSRKMVRCARCGGDWAPEQEAETVIEAPASEAVVEAPEPTGPSADPKAKPDVVLGAVTAMDRLAANPPPPPRSLGLIGAWVLTIIVLATAVSATITWRREFMSIWPPSGLILGPIEHMLSKPEQVTGR
jgi:predicted Zn finger-like uncharacterized protein